MARLNHAGGAVITTLTADITSGALSISINSATGWPTGGVNGEFYITIDPDLPGEERILVASRSGTTLTVASASKRGVDDTSAAAHTTGATVIHSFAGAEADEANRHINDTTIDEHTQYMRTDGTRHDLTARHAVGSVVPAAAPIDLVPDAANSAGVSTSAARADHSHGITAATPGSILPDAVAAEGVATSFARSDHTHGIGAAAPGNILPDDVAAEGASTSFARADHTHGITAAAPSDIGTANTEGVATSFARSDHVHDAIFTELRRDTGAGSGGLTTSYVSQGATLSLPAGTWLIFGKWRTSSSTAARFTHQCRIQNTTDGLTVDEADESIDSAVSPENVLHLTVFDAVTIAGTKTFDLQGKTSATGGTQLGSTALLVAIKCTEII